MRSALQMLERKNNWRERLRSGLPENTFYGVSKGTRGSTIQKWALPRDRNKAPLPV